MFIIGIRSLGRKKHLPARRAMALLSLYSHYTHYRVNISTSVPSVSPTPARRADGITFFKQTNHVGLQEVVGNGTCVGLPRKITLQSPELTTGPFLINLLEILGD